MIQIQIDQGQYAIISSKAYTKSFNEIEDVAWQIMTDLLEEESCLYSIHSVDSYQTLSELYNILQRYIKCSRCSNVIHINSKCVILSGFCTEGVQITIEKYFVKEGAQC